MNPNPGPEPEPQAPSLRPPPARPDPQVAYEQLEELSTLLRLHLRHGLQEEALWLLDGFEQLSGEVAPTLAPTLPLPSSSSPAR